ncbi:hypothetical protein ABID08_005119 [Rhizobium binae]|uniref:Uncharacterized protein n=1 Tax=Rhizobium binae TaxID=1138190 RepID=A0ABV2MQT7_9HYPH|nr:hypothetical protein [Rhizobium binae]MBX4990978.1 hypothetical protein [Rhizobium binae]QSY81978.1 hypothetical protein J2J99_20485 [Rhizobium binae]
MFSGAQVSPFPMSSRFAGTILDVFDSFAHLQRRATLQLRKGRCGTLNCLDDFILAQFRFEQSCRRTKA